MHTTLDGCRHTVQALVIGVLLSIIPATTRAQCVGDCGGDNAVTVDEIMVGVNIALGNTTVGACLAFSGGVTVDGLIAAVNNAQIGCPPLEQTPTPTDTPEEPSATETATSVPTDTPTLIPTDVPTLIPTATMTPALSTPTVTATASATATYAPAVCGNGIVEAGESCDDGNTITNPPTDTCPADCTIITCTPSGTKRTVSVTFTPPAGKSVATITVLLEYPDGEVQIPGTGDDDTVTGALSNAPSGFLLAAFDYNYAVSVGVAGTRAITPGKLFDLSADVCQGATPTASMFKCTVTEASGTNFLPIDGVSCTATLP